MTDLRKLLDRASKGKWSTVGPTLVIPWHSNHAMPIELSIANAELVAAAVNALPDLLAVCEAAQRHTAAVYRKATCDAAGAFDASVEFEDSYNALTAALAQWEKQNG